MTKSHLEPKSNYTANTILVFAGLDPSGGAGISADIETLSNLNTHTLPIVTCLTVQDTKNVKRVEPVEKNLLQQQVETLTQDIAFQAIKIGLLSNADIIELVAQTLTIFPDIPVIFDPILRAGGGTRVTHGDANNIVKLMREKIIPHTTLITPNSLEARMLVDKKNLNDCAEELIQLGCKNVLITGEHENDPITVSNTLYSVDDRGLLNSIFYRYPRLPHKYHGSGCTLASASSVYLSQNMPIAKAAQCAQDFTYNTLIHAKQLGKTQFHPDRTIKS